MKRMPTDDDAFGQGMIREDGQMIAPVHLFQVKTPEESRGAGDLFKLLETVPADPGFPAAEGRRLSARPDLTAGSPAAAGAAGLSRIAGVAGMTCTGPCGRRPQSQHITPSPAGAHPGTAARRRGARHPAAPAAWPRRYPM